MKTLFLALSLVVATVSTASAGEPTIEPPLPQGFTPVVNNVSIEIGGLCDGPICPAVEPWVDIQFDYASCAAQSFHLDKVDGVDGVELTIVLDSAFDCFGPTTTRTYTLQVESAASVSNIYKLQNPIGVLPQF